METFAPGDRVVAINTDLSRPMHDPTGSPLSAFSFPDGPLRRTVIYHVASVHPQASGTIHHWIERPESRLNTQLFIQYF